VTGGIVSLSIVLLLLALAVCAVLVRDAFLAIAGFVAYGLLLSLVWVRLYGIDVALTEAAIGGGDANRRSAAGSVRPLTRGDGSTRGGLTRVGLASSSGYCRSSSVTDSRGWPSRS